MFLLLQIKRFYMSHVILKLSNEFGEGDKT